MKCPLISSGSIVYILIFNLKMQSAVLEIRGSRYDIPSLKYNFFVETDHIGYLITKAKGGEIDVVIESSSDHLIHELMALKSDPVLKGGLVISSLQDDMTPIRRIEW